MARRGEHPTPQPHPLLLELDNRPRPQPPTHRPTHPTPGIRRPARRRRTPTTPATLPGRRGASHPGKGSRRAHPPLRPPGPANPAPHHRPTHAEGRRHLPDGRPTPGAAAATARCPAPRPGLPVTGTTDDPPRTEHTPPAVSRQSPRTTHRRTQPHQPAQPARHQRPTRPQRSPRSTRLRPASRDPRRPPRPPRQHRRPMDHLRTPRLDRLPRRTSRRARRDCFKIGVSGPTRRAWGPAGWAL